MSNAKHTPGPWEYIDHGKTDALFGKYVPRFEVFPLGMSCESICTISTCNSVPQANARLIAAAPELLAALEALLGYDSLGAYERANVRKHARAAIAKAKGDLL